MKTFTLNLHSATHAEQIPGIISFVGTDSSGSFGIRAGHARLMTTLVMGLSRFRTDMDSWSYLALTGAVLYFHDNLLTLCTRHYVVDNDYSRINHALQQQLLKEEEKLRSMKESLRHMEQAVLKRMWQMDLGGTE